MIVIAMNLEDVQIFNEDVQIFNEDVQKFNEQLEKEADLKRKKENDLIKQIAEVRWGEINLKNSQIQIKCCKI